MDLRGQTKQIQREGQAAGSRCCHQLQILLTEKRAKFRFWSELIAYRVSTCILEPPAEYIGKRRGVIICINLVTKGIKSSFMADLFLKRNRLGHKEQGRGNIQRTLRMRLPDQCRSQGMQFTFVCAKMFQTFFLIFTAFSTSGEFLHLHLCSCRYDSNVVFLQWLPLIWWWWETTMLCVLVRV